MHLYDVIQKPILTEKAHIQTVAAKYSFKVHPDANKIQIRRAIEALYGVSVTDVNTSCFMGKTKGSWRRKGSRPDWKKAVVTLKEGDVIEELFEAA